MRESASRASLTPLMATAQPWSPPMTSNAIRIAERTWLRRGEAPVRQPLRASVDSQDLTALVKTTRRTNPMWHIRCGALRTGAQLRQLQNAVVRPTHTHAAG